VRLVEPLFGYPDRLSDELLHWLAVLEDAGRPARELPPLERAPVAPGG
jgi:hypothetical protein